jgi:hypothetical protein
MEEQVVGRKEKGSGVCETACGGPAGVLFSHINSASATSYQPANSIFLSQRISLSY